MSLARLGAALIARASHGQSTIATMRLDHAVLAVCLAASAACGSTTTAAPTHASTPTPTRAERIAAGCAPTWAEALERVGPLSSQEVPQTRGYSLAQLDPPPEDPPPLPDPCHYPEGACRAVRYESRCSVRVDYRCGASEADFDTSALLLPCDRPALP